MAVLSGGNYIKQKHQGYRPCCCSYQWLSKAIKQEALNSTWPFDTASVLWVASSVQRQCYSQFFSGIFRISETEATSNESDFQIRVRQFLIILSPQNYTGAAKRPRIRRGRGYIPPRRGALLTRQVCQSNAKYRDYESVPGERQCGLYQITLDTCLPGARVGLKLLAQHTAMGACKNILLQVW